MAVLSATNLEDFSATRASQEPRQTLTAIIANAARLFPNALVGMNDGTGAGTKGHLVPYSNTAGVRYLGLYLGDDTTGDGTIDNLGTVDVSGLRVKQVSVAGASATSVGDMVYSTTDNLFEDLTLTAPASDAEPVAQIVRHLDGTTVDIDLLPAEILSPKPVVLGQTYVADGAIDLPAQGVLRTIVRLDGNAATAQMTLAAPGATLVGQELILIATDVSNAVDVDYTDSGGAVTHTFTEVGESVILFASTAAVWSRHSNNKDDV